MVYLITPDFVRNILFLVNQTIFYVLTFYFTKNMKY